MKIQEIMNRCPFIGSLILFLICSFCLFLLQLVLIYGVGGLFKAVFDMSGDDIGVPVSGIVIGALIFLAAAASDVYYAIKAESRLGFFIWLLGIPLFWALSSLVSVIDGENYMTSEIGVTAMYFYRLPLFAIVRTYSYLAKDEKRKNLSKEHNNSERNFNMSTESINLLKNNKLNTEKNLRNLIKFSTPGDFSKWEQECLPIGNGYMGASFFGGISEEKVVLNEKTLWTGGPSDNDPEYYGGNKRDRYPFVKQVQQLLHDGEYEKALDLLPELTGLQERYGAYQLLCDLYIKQSFSDNENLTPNDVSDYLRVLDMDNAVFSTAFKVNGTVYSREAFANYPSNIICIKLWSDKKAAVSFTLSLGEIQWQGEVRAKDNRLIYNGRLADNLLRYAAVFEVKNKGGEVKALDGELEVIDADEAVIYIAAATDYSPDFYKRYRNDADPLEGVENNLDNARKKGYDNLLREHLEDYRKLFSRCALSLNGASGEPEFADKLVEGYAKGNVREKSQLEELYFQFGRYMLIGSSRIGSLPANLQGVWNESNCPPWNCDYHINVNLQMNYWGAYNTNLAETAAPLVEFLNDLRPAGRVTAKEYFGIVSDENNPENGWTAHTAVNPFGWTAPGWDFYWGWSTAAAAWLMQNIWEHYEFTGDKGYLEKKIYPIMLESVKFYSQWLIYDDKQDRLVSTPTYSPEHGPITVGNTYEQSLIEQLYRDFITASEVLDRDKELREKIRSDVEKLKPYHIGKTGRLKEWYEEDESDFDSSKVQPGHRHISHLMGLYPGRGITRSNPELMTAAINTMNHRGDESTGWARAYKLNLWARTGDGNRAYRILSGLLSSCTFKNLFDFHPPFQLDGNFGGSAGIAEMLLQSHEGYVYPLAALPDSWSEGEFKGLCARGGFEISAEWKDKKLTMLSVLSKCGNELKIRCNPKRILQGNKEIAFKYDNEVVIMNTVQSGEYIFEF